MNENNIRKHKIEIRYELYSVNDNVYNLFNAKEIMKELIS